MGRLTRGVVAAVGCIAMQVPYGLAGEPRRAGVFGEVLCTMCPTADVDFTGYDDHWWWDNLAHYLGGYAVGTALSIVFEDEHSVMKAFLAITGAWEVFEYTTNERPWHRYEDGEMVWEWDHAMEDTMLDTLMGAAGAYTAAAQ